MGGTARGSRVEGPGREVGEVERKARQRGSRDRKKGEATRRVHTES